MRSMVSPAAKAITASSWRTISTEPQLLERLELSRQEGRTCGYLPGLYEYIVPGKHRSDLRQSLERGLVLELDLSRNEAAACDSDEGDVGKVILVLMQDARISSLKSPWIASIVAHTRLGFEAALWHAHSVDVAERMESMSDNAAVRMPFFLAFDDAVPLEPGTLAHALPRVTDECVVLSYRHDGNESVQ